jgi:cold shock CspA family protein
MRSTGRLTAWNQVTGRGSASMDNVPASVFVSKRALRAPLNSSLLAVGQMVEFSLGTNALGLVGSDVM